MINIPVSVGELIDKLSILQVKKQKIKNEEKLAYVNKEFELLYNLSSVYLNEAVIESLYHQLVQVNSSLWEVEDRLRVLEVDQKFEGELCLDRIEPGKCGDKCIKVCQVSQSGALKVWPEEGGVDMFKCNFGPLRNRGLACGMCIKVCPVGKR